MRTTNQDLERIVSRIAQKLGKNLEIGYAYGSPRVYYTAPAPGSWLSELSPRLPKGQLFQWLCAFEAGIDAYSDTVTGRNNPRPTQG